MKTRRLAGVGCLLLGLALCVPAAAQDRGKEKSGEKKQTAKADSTKAEAPYAQATRHRSQSGKGKVYTNEDLERMFGGGAPPPSPTNEGGETTTADKPAGDAKDAKTPLDQLFEEQRLAEEHQEEIAAAEKRVSEAEQRVTDLEKRVLATKNPLLPRPAPPAEDEEGAANWAGMDNQQRLSQSEAALQAAREELAKARQTLSDLRSSGP